GSKGLSDARLMSLASHAGVRGVGTCIASEKFKNWTESATEAALDDSVNGTPTAFIDGHKLSYDRALDPHAFAAAIRHAVQDA
ncbi:MAG: DsbA family protein, partial [Nocardioidaceae bacterium]